MDHAPRIRLRTVWPLLGLTIVLFAAIFLPHLIWNSLLIGVGGVYLVAYGWLWVLARGLEMERHLNHGWVAVGDRLEETFMVRNPTFAPLLWGELIDQSNVPGYTARMVISASAGSEYKWRMEAVCMQRGQFHLGPWRLRTMDPFGIFDLTFTYPISAEVVIHPPIHTEIPISLPFGRRSGQARSRDKAWQATINAAGVRDYQTGDPTRWIHWPTSARRGDLFVREFDLDAAGDIWLLLDLEKRQQLGSGRDGTEEHAVLLAASLSSEGLSHNRPVGLAMYNHEPQLIVPNVSEGQQWRLLRALALARAEGDLPLPLALADLAGQVRRGSAVVVITPSMETDWLPNLIRLQEKGVTVTVVLLDRQTFGGEPGADLLRRQVQRMGLRAHIIRQGDVGQAPEEEKRGFFEYRVTPMGKVVVVRRPGDG